ncbi:MAG: hypothetical protein K2X61_13805 [Caulobacteraceae bacterium]|nr:hypothetical protein [Caulobacteraceae bacterium]
MSVSSLTLIAALAVLPLQQDTPSDDPRVEVRTETRVVTLGGLDDSERLDTNDDGFVDREEFSAPLTRAFGRLDQNEDGRLSPEELRGGRGEGPGPRIMMFGGPGGHHGGPGGRAMVFGGSGGEDNVFVFRHGGPDGSEGPGRTHVEVRRFGGSDSDMDANEDGRVTEEEFLAPLREAFRRMDEDRDGALEDGERPGRDR